MNKEKLLLVEDDVNFGFVLKSFLEMNNYHVTLISDGADAVNAFLSQEYNLCILDVMLPNVDGFTIAKEIKKISPSCPIVFLTARTMHDDVMHGYSVGADDYLTKPFETEVLLVKIKAILRRNFNIKPGIGDVVTIGKFKFNTKIRALTSQDETYKLTPRESELLKQLYINKNSILDREEALKKIWGDDNYFNARSMDVYITKLRKYFKDDPRVKIENIHGSGFILMLNE
ncbi:MAG: response regulator transcription factor [Bacteroidales bacterium]|nr:response regulator transcription factor [Bacteroidales bacterium]